MTGAVVEIRHTKWESQRNLGLAKGLRDSVADHLRRRWPTNTAKNAARTYSLTLDRAREAAAGRASLTTLETIFKVGGWPVAVAILADVIGYSIAHYFADIRKRHNEAGNRLATLFGFAGLDRDGAASGDLMGADGGDLAGDGVGDANAWVATEGLTSKAGSAGR